MNLYFPQILKPQSQVLQTVTAIKARTMPINANDQATFILVVCWLNHALPCATLSLVPGSSSSVLDVGVDVAPAEDVGVGPMFCGAASMAVKGAVSVEYVRMDLDGTYTGAERQKPRGRMILVAACCGSLSKDKLIGLYCCVFEM